MKSFASISKLNLKGKKEDIQYNKTFISWKQKIVHSMNIQRDHISPKWKCLHDYLLSLPRLRFFPLVLASASSAFGRSLLGVSFAFNFLLLLGFELSLAFWLEPSAGLPPGLRWPSVEGFVLGESSFFDLTPESWASLDFFLDLGLTLLGFTPDMEVSTFALKRIFRVSLDLSLFTDLGGPGLMLRASFSLSNLFADSVGRFFSLWRLSRSLFADFPLPLLDFLGVSSPATSTGSLLLRLESLSFDSRFMVESGLLIN